MIISQRCSKPIRRRPTGRRKSLPVRKTSSTDESDRKEVRKCIHQGERVEDWNCLDKADHPTDRAAVEAANSIPHLRRIGEEQLDQAGSNAGRSSSATTGS